VALLVKPAPPLNVRHEGVCPPPLNRGLCFGALRFFSLRAQWLCKHTYAVIRGVIIRLQAWWRTMFCMHTYLGSRFAARRIERAVVAHMRSKTLAAWAQDFHSCCIWGDVGACLRPCPAVFAVCVCMCLPVCPRCARAWLPKAAAPSVYACAHS
jgi:hypothetical protein